MLHDTRGIALTTESQAAAVALDATVDSLLGHRADLGVHLTACLIADPDLVAAQALAGFAALVQARQELGSEAALRLAAARAALLRRGGTTREHGLVAALALWQERGDIEGAAAQLGAILEAAPLDAMTLKLDHSIRFMIGDVAGMRRVAESVAAAWTPDVEGHGYVLGQRAFTLEETGEACAAERLGRAAVAAAPADLWGGHAVAHVMEGDGRAKPGLDWIDGQRAHFTAAGSFGRHLLWHAALFHLHLGRPEAALELHDGWVHDRPAEDVRDFANAASLLWRLEAQGLPVGQARWDALAVIAARRSAECGLAFIDLHHVLVLGAAGRLGELDDKLAAMRAQAASREGCQAAVLAGCGLPVAEAIACLQRGDAVAAAAILLPLHGRMRRLGGSIAQRDLFERVLVEACLAAGRGATAAMLLEDRRAVRALGAWEAHCTDRIKGQIVSTGSSCRRPAMNGSSPHLPTASETSRLASVS
jgi:hypothetical protein